MANFMVADNFPVYPIKPGTDESAARIRLMVNRKKNLIDIFSRTTIVVSMALMSGLALGHVTEKSMQPRLSAELPSDPVERFGLGQNAYLTANVNIKPIGAESHEYADASYEIGRYVNGARVLAPFEPARKIDRIRLERLQAWNDENFGSDVDLYDEGLSYAEMNIEDHQPIDLGAVEESPESAAGHAVSYNAIDESMINQENISIDLQQISAQSAPDDHPVLTKTDG